MQVNEGEWLMGETAWHRNRASAPIKGFPSAIVKRAGCYWDCDRFWVVGKRLSAKDYRQKAMGKRLSAKDYR